MTESTRNPPSQWSERFELPYRILSGDDSDERACSAIPESACTEIPRNYGLNVLNGAATKLAEQLASPGLVLPWLFASIGAPAALAALPAPIKQAGSLLPQLFVAARIRALARRKWAWVAAGCLQALALLLAGLAALALPPLPAGLAIVALFALFSIFSGVGSIAFQDVVGKTIPKGRRGRMLANRATIGGLLTLGAAAALTFWIEGEDSVALNVSLLFGAALLWALGALAFAGIEEAPGAETGGRSLLGELREGRKLLGRSPGFRRYLACRALLLGIEVAMPFYALHAKGLLGGEIDALGLYVFAVGAANVVSSPFWGAWSDRSSRSVLAWAGAIGVLAGLAALGIALLPEGYQSPWLYAQVFLVLGIAEAGVRLGRKTYLVDAAPQDERPLYVAVSNTMIGVLALSAGLLGLLADLTAPLAVILLLALLSALGVIAALRLPPAEDFGEAEPAT